MFSDCGKRSWVRAVACTGVILASGWAGSSAEAAAVPSVRFYDGNLLDVQSVTGAGPNTTYLVLNFDSNSTTTPAPVVAWQYDWSTPVSVSQMFDDIAAAPGSDFGVSYNPNYGEDFVSQFTYGSTTGTVSGNWNFQSGVYAASSVSSTDPQGITWTDFDSGTADTDLSTGYDFVGIQGLDAQYNAPALLAPEAATPEPTTLACGALLSCALLRRRRNLA